MNAALEDKSSPGNESAAATSLKHLVSDENECVFAGPKPTPYITTIQHLLTAYLPL